MPIALVTTEISHSHDLSSSGKLVENALFPTLSSESLSAQTGQDQLEWKPELQKTQQLGIPVESIDRSKPGPVVLPYVLGSLHCTYPVHPSSET